MFYRHPLRYSSFYCLMFISTMKMFLIFFKSSFYLYLIYLGNLSLRPLVIILIKHYNHKPQYNCHLFLSVASIVSRCLVCKIYIKFTKVYDAISIHIYVYTANCIYLLFNIYYLMIISLAMHYLINGLIMKGVFDLEVFLKTFICLLTNNYLSFTVYICLIYEICNHFFLIIILLIIISLDFYGYTIIFYP